MKDIVEPIQDTVPCGVCRQPRPLDDLLDALLVAGAFAETFLKCPACVEVSRRRAAFYVIEGKGADA